MKEYIVDTNVAIVANGKSPQADPDCVIACIEILEEVYLSGIIVIDDSKHILREYMRNLSMSGQPGPGDFFMKWVWTNQADLTRCKQVNITSSKHAGDFDEFPNDPKLKKFDRSDRKFVAVALKQNCTPLILNAVDTDWAEHYEALHELGLQIAFLCKQHVCPQ